MAREDGTGADGAQPDNAPIHTVDDYPLDEFDVDVTPGQRRGAHRVATPPLLAAVPWVLGGLFLVALIVVMITFSGGGDDQQASATATKPTATASASKKPTAAPANVDKGVRLLVLNGTQRYRLDRAAKRRLVEDGWIVTDTGVNDNRQVGRTLVVYKDKSLKDTASALAKFLGGGDLSLDPNLPEDMRVVVGENFQE